MTEKTREPYIVVRALEAGVTIIGLTRGDETKSHHIEKLDEGDVLVAEFTDRTSAIKVKGKAEITTAFGTTVSGK